MHDRGVIPATEVTTDLLETEPGVPSSQPHADLARHGDRLVPSFAQQIRQLDVVVAGDRIDDRLDRRCRRFVPDLSGGIISKGSFGELQGDGLVFSQ